MFFIDNKEYIALERWFLTKKNKYFFFLEKNGGADLVISIFISIFASDFTKNLYSKNREKEKFKLHIMSYGKKHI